MRITLVIIALAFLFEGSVSGQAAGPPGPAAGPAADYPDTCFLPICPEICLHGHKIDSEGCPICACKEKPTVAPKPNRSPTYNCATNDPCTKQNVNEYFRHDDVHYFIQCSTDVKCYEVECPANENCDAAISSTSKYS